jgi:hypothetical protein
VTIEIRQMVIKSSVGSAAEKSPAKGAGKARPTAEDDCGCGDDCAGGGGQQERQKMRSAFAVEWERMRER